MKTNNITKFLRYSSLSVLLLGTALTVPAEQAQAAGSQVFGPMTYVNPAQMDLFCQNFNLTLGGDLFFLKGKFNGSNNVLGRVTGQSTTNDNVLLPYGQIMYRIPQMSKMVIGFDVSNPQGGLLKFENGPLVGTRTYLRTQNYSAKVSYHLFEDWVFGVGVDVLNNVGGVASFVVPGRGLQNRNDQGRGARVGWDAGLTWKINQGGWLGASYHSKMMLNSRGRSAFPGLPTQIATLNANIPDTYTLSYLQFLSEKWLVNFTARYMGWKQVYRSFNIKNDALTPGGTLVFPLNYKNSWMGQVFSRYQLAEQWAVLGAVEYDSNPQPKRFRPASFPADQLWYLGAGVQYMPTKTTQVQLFYGYVTSSPKFNNVGNNPQATVGKLKLTGNQFDISFTYKF
jgi:long-subunit fatty acid transport protein